MFVAFVFMFVFVFGVAVVLNAWVAIRLIVHHLRGPMHNNRGRVVNNAGCHMVRSSVFWATAAVMERECFGLCGARKSKTGRPYHSCHEGEGCGVFHGFFLPKLRAFGC